MIKLEENKYLYRNYFSVKNKECVFWTRNLYSGKTEIVQLGTGIREV